jgi:hypothetical protein
MALKFKFKTREEIPAEQVSLYTEREGAWGLDVEGAIDKSRLEELRASNATLSKERDELKARFEGIDPEEARALLAERQKREEEKLLKGGDEAANEEAQRQERERIEKVIENRIKGVKGELEKQVTTLTTERDALTARLTAIQIDQGVVTVATKRGLRPTALADITARARSVFKSVRYGRDGLTPMTLEEWVDTQVADAPHLFEANAGGGSAGNAASSGGLGARAHGLQKNPFKRETWNLTEQMRLLKSDPNLAARLKAAA